LRLLVKQISGVLARRIVCAAQPGATLARGEKYGMIKFGSRTELYVPVERCERVEVAVGQKVRGGETVLARLTARAPSPSLPEVSSLPTASTDAEGAQK
jgi:phosphatidylserine decarboxylase